MRGDRTLSELAAQFDVHSNQIQDCKKKLMKGGKEVFGEGTASATGKEVEAEKPHAMAG